jgi:hypothetical protein
MRIAILALALASAVATAGCFFSLDGSLLTRPRESSVRDARVDGVDGAATADVVLEGIVREGSPDQGTTPDTAPRQ